MCLTKLLYRLVRFDTSYIIHGRKRLRVLVADSAAKMILGLMHRKRMGSTDGMLFMPGREARHGIWMRNMLFSIDILWISKNGTVLDMVENARPCSSMFDCPTYRPLRDSFYVLELGAGRARAMKIHKGTRLEIAKIKSNKRQI